MKKIARILGILCLTGCASLTQSEYAIRIHNLNKPLLQIQKIVSVNLPLGLRTTSTNEREFSSRYFIVDGNNLKDSGDAADRYFEKTTVLGDQRPYSVDVVVIHERRVFQTDHYIYENAGYNMRLAKILAAKLKVELTKRREPLNIIDDFRVF